MIYVWSDIPNGNRQKPPEMALLGLAEREVDKLTGRKAKALQALLTCPTRAEAAQQAGIGESTLREYLNDPEFIKEYERQLSNLITEAAQQGKQGLSEALSTLREINSDKDRPASARISAARSLLEYGIRLTEIVDLIRKLEVLEAKIDAERKAKD